MDLDLELLTNKNKLKKNKSVKDISADMNIILCNILEIELKNENNKITQLLVNINKLLNNIHKKKDVDILDYLKLNILLIQKLKKQEIENNLIKNKLIDEQNEINYMCKEIIDNIITKIEEKENTKNIKVDSHHHDKLGIEKYIIVKSVNQ